MTQPLGGHEEITGFLTLELSAEIKRKFLVLELYNRTKFSGRYYTFSRLV
jgi:hypothetical protein